MKHLIVALVIGLSLAKTNAAVIANPTDTVVPSKHKFVSSQIYKPKAFSPAILVKQFMEHLKAGKHTIGFLHQDEIDMLGEKKLTEKRLFFDSYKVISIGKRMAIVKVYTARGTSISCKQLMLRYYQNMQGHYLLVPGKISRFEKKMGDITLKKVFLDTWTMEQRCQ